MGKRAELRVLDVAGVRVPRTGAVGGGYFDAEDLLADGTARSPGSAQLRADVPHRTALVCTEPDVTLLGAAALALVGAAPAGDLDDARARIGRAFHRLDPDPERAQRYDALFRDWLRIRDTRADTRPAPGTPGRGPARQRSG